MNLLAVHVFKELFNEVTQQSAQRLGFKRFQRLMFEHFVLRFDAVVRMN